MVTFKVRIIVQFWCFSQYYELLPLPNITGMHKEAGTANFTYPMILSY